MDIDDDSEQTESKLTVESLEDIVTLQTPINESLHMRFVIEIAYRSKIFSDDDAIWPVPSPSVVGTSGKTLLALT